MNRKFYLMTVDFSQHSVQKFLVPTFKDSMAATTALHLRLDSSERTRTSSRSSDYLSRA